MLHITNGDSVIASFHDGSIPGAYLAWADALHDGAVPRTSTLEALSDVRARELADLHGGDYDEIRASFARRDRTLADFRRDDETVLWFEHDLYDQLQLVQLLDWFSRQDLAGVRLSVIQIGEHPELPDFHGLGELSGPQLARLLPMRAPVSARQLEIGRQAWEAFCAPDPTALVSLARRKEPDMPFLAAALQRLLEEYPSACDGLSRTERQLLAAGAAGARHRRDFYLQSQAPVMERSHRLRQGYGGPPKLHAKAEDRPVQTNGDRPLRTNGNGGHALDERADNSPWGDGSVYVRLDRLATGHKPALDRLGDDEFAINDQGHRLLACEDDWITSSGLDVWLGGVHMTGPDGWRWDEDARTLTSL